MTKFKVGDRVKVVPDSGYDEIDFSQDKEYIVKDYSCWDSEYIIIEDNDGHDRDRWEGEFEFVEKATAEIEPWNLMQVSIHNKEKFKEVLLNILHEGRTLTPMEVVKVEDFLGVL